MQLSGAHWLFNLIGTLSIPIWDGGSREGKLRVSRAVLAEKQAVLAATRRGATVQQIQAERAVAVARAARVTSQRESGLAEESARITRSAFTAGGVTAFDVVDTARKAREAALDLVGKDYDLVRSRVDALLASASCRQ
jgi:outer membrane protein TolC